MRSLLPPETAVLQGAFAAPLRLLLVPFMVLVCALQAQQEALMSEFLPSGIQTHRAS